MKQVPSNTAVGRQVELIIRRLSSLSTLPSVANTFLPLLMQNGGDKTHLAEIIKSDAALTARIMSLADASGIKFTNIADALNALPETVVKDAVLSVKVFQAFDAGFDPDASRVLPRKQLALHMLAVACGAKEIAIATGCGIDPEMAFSAGLLHDLGKLAIDDVMPKSFEKIVSEARSQGTGISEIEIKYLGIDHGVLGKRLAQKWNLPGPISMAMWLHHDVSEIIASRIADAKYALIVSIADAIARKLGIGDSGSYDTPQISDAMLDTLNLSSEQLVNIEKNVAEQVKDRVSLLSLAVPNQAAKWCDSIQSTTAQIAKSNSKLSEENKNLQLESITHNFISEFLTSVTASSEPIDIAADFAQRWLKFYQAGSVCVFVSSLAQDDWFESAIMAEGKQQFAIFKSVKIAQNGSGAVVRSALHEVPWIFEQCPISFDQSKAKFIELSAHGKIVGGIVFDCRYPLTSEVESRMLLSARAAAGVFAWAIATRKNELMAENFAHLLRELRQMQEQLGTAKSLLAVAEIAAGAAHELNNPLAVISGRAQLLMSSETDPSKKQMLKQIDDRAAEMASMINDLMKYAKPGTAKNNPVTVEHIVKQAVAQTAAKHDASNLEIKLTGLDEMPEINVDTGQIVDAVSNVFSNALESYPGQRGPIFVQGQYDSEAERVELKISDHGCGMDNETLQKAINPFFSAKLAGRKRGMGLAHAHRFIQINGGTLKLSSQPGAGTAVTMTFPAMNTQAK